MELVVGTEACEIAEAVAVFFGSPAAVVVAQKWTILARNLGVNAITRHTLAKREIWQQIDAISVLEEVLNEWKQKKSNNATLVKLTDVMEAAGLNDSANLLKAKYGILNEGNAETGSSETSNDALESPLKLHLEYNMAYLIDILDLNDQLLNKVETKGFFVSNEISLLKFIDNSEDQSRMFWQLIAEKVGNKEDVFDELIQVFASEPKNHRKEMIGSRFKTELKNTN